MVGGTVMIVSARGSNVDFVEVMSTEARREHGGRQKAVELLGVPFHTD